MAKRRIYIVDDDRALRRLLVRMLASTGADVLEFDTAEKFIDGYVERPIGVVLLDLRLPGMSGLDLLELVAGLWPENPIIMISGFADISSAVRAVKTGAFDFVQKPFRKSRLLEVVGKAFERIEMEADAARPFENLTPREQDVLEAFADGAPNKVVAHRLELSPRTVEMHRARIFRKLGVHNLSQALMRARDANLIGPI
jgi:two-component system response regulator FixJ